MNSGYTESLSLSVPRSLPEIPLVSPTPSFVLPLSFLRFRVFLFAKARIATGDERACLPFPRDLHKISIFEARSREKYIGESRGARWMMNPLLPKTGPSHFNAERITKEKSLFSRLGPISRLRPVFSLPLPLLHPFFIFLSFLPSLAGRSTFASSRSLSLFLPSH